MSEVINQLRSSKFKQQKLPARQPILKPRSVIPTMLILGVFFIVLGVIFVLSVDSVIEVSKRYDDKCKIGSNCTITFEPPSDMESPVYFYYQLTNYYQNHRRYVKSRDDTQLGGENLSYEEAEELCDPIISLDGEKKDSMVYQPCGLIVWSQFNDTLTVKNGDEVLDFNEKGIAWESDIEKKFKNPDPLPDPDSQTTLQSDYTDEHFVVWMRVAALPTFRKLYAILEKGKLEKGKQYSVNIENHYPVSSFDGQKSIIFTTTTWVGGKNSFLGYAYISLGSILFLIGLGFLLKHLIKPRPLGKEKYLKWD
ncbi:cell cycle control protein [Anaeramoeba flamelloides]|uniref:Cell cycle control protein n=1 Tax=Anaeramoeba flamelloides TaxID=1746091 RepID=A0AAV7ZBA4_9EUKA|nr:cell cycle control protein [Anaeramoeba flamelloides]KAJ6231173.1 cell cycle control protein [Anaeramoeba flamelloides]